MVFTRPIYNVFCCQKLKISDDIASIIVMIASVIMLSEYHQFNLSSPMLINFCTYYVYFVFGFVINYYEDSINAANDNVVLKVILIITSIILMYRIPRLETQLYMLFALYVVIPRNTNSFISVLDKNSFGIYLFHSPLIYITYSNIPNANPLIVVAINFLIMGFIAYLLTCIIRKTSFKFIIGE